MKTSKLKKFLVFCIAATFVFGLVTVASAAEIKIGGIMDTTGATSDVGKDYAIGMDEAFKYFNETGGVNGKQIKYTWFDYGYRIPEAITKYKLLKRLGVVAIMGWGTGDTEALSPTVNKDEIPYVSASYSAHLTDPAKTPYNLFFSSDYSTNARACLTAWFDKKWPGKADYGKRKPRFACVYMFASPYCSAPIKAVKDQAALLGFDVGPDSGRVPVCAGRQEPDHGPEGIQAGRLVARQHNHVGFGLHAGCLCPRIGCGLDHQQLGV